jgi:hypothetical protein
MTAVSQSYVFNLELYGSKVIKFLIGVELYKHKQLKVVHTGMTPKDLKMLGEKQFH